VKDNLPDHHRRPTSVGENPGSDLGTLCGLLVLAGASVAASYVVARMTHAVGTPEFTGMRLLFAWATWLYSTYNVNGLYVPGQHVRQFNAYGWSVVRAIEITWGAGVALSLLLYVCFNRLSSPRSRQDVREIKDSARMSTEADYREAGFLPD